MAPPTGKRRGRADRIELPPWGGCLAPPGRDYDGRYPAGVGGRAARRPAQRAAIERATAKRRIDAMLHQRSARTFDSIFAKFEEIGADVNDDVAAQQLLFQMSTPTNRTTHRHHDHAGSNRRPPTRFDRDVTRRPMSPECVLSRIGHRDAALRTTRNVALKSARDVPMIVI
jgi:hypothetical protein